MVNLDQSYYRKFELSMKSKSVEDDDQTIKIALDLRMISLNLSR